MTLWAVMKLTLFQLVVVLFALTIPQVATADGLFVLVTEVDETGEASFWWQTANPQWTATDAALRTALEREGVGFAEPATDVKLSRIYRRPGATDANALAMASVFGHDRVLAGTIEFRPTALRPVGLTGWEAVAELRLLHAGATDGGLPIVVTRATWASSDDEALQTLRDQMSDAVARSVVGELVKKRGPVGVESGEPVLGFRALGTTDRLEVIEQTLLGFAGVSSVGVAWATEGFIAIEINPLETDSAQSVRQYAALLAQSDLGFTLEAVDASFPGTIEFTPRDERR